MRDRTWDTYSTWEDSSNVWHDGPDVYITVQAASCQESDQAFCTRLGKNCNSVTGTDVCGRARTASCGSSCPSGQMCGGGGIQNVCGSTTHATAAWYGFGENWLRVSEWQAGLAKLAAAGGWGFNVIRFGIYEPNDTDTPGGGSNDPAAGYAYQESVISMIASYGMKVVLDYHWNYGNGQYFGSSNWLKYWQSMATHYKNDPRIMAFELFNEAWPDYLAAGGGFSGVLDAYAACTDKVRAIDPTRTVVWQLWPDLKDLGFGMERWEETTGPFPTLHRPGR